MNKKYSVLALAGAALLGLAMVFAVNAKEDKEAKKADKEKELTVKAETREMAATVNFRKEYELPFESLTTLGSRIDQLRLSNDPVGLSAAASELWVAEKVSGKKAKVTASDLQSEAVKLAKIRDRHLELQAVALRVEDKKVKEELEKLADEAKKREEEELKAQKRGDKERGVLGTIRIANDTAYTIQVQVNGQDFFYVNKYRNYTHPTKVGHGSDTDTVITAYAVEDPSKTWSWAPYNGVVQNVYLKVPPQ